MAPGPPDEIASLEAKLEEAFSRERELTEQKTGLETRLGALDQEIAAEASVQTGLKQQLASGANVETEIEASERRILGFKRLRDGIAAFLADTEAPLTAAGAEIGRSSNQLETKRLERERDSLAEELDALDSKMWTTAGDLVRMIDRQKRLCDRLCERYKEGPRLFTERILGRRDERRRGAILAINETGRLDLNRILPF